MGLAQHPVRRVPWEAFALAALGLLLSVGALLAPGWTPALRGLVPGGRAGDTAGPGGRAADADAETLLTALAAGNHLARRGEPEAAVEAYRAAWPGLAAAGAEAGPAAALAYNLGTTHHRLDRLPEALLWYRRAAALAPADAWLVDNLELARAELSAARLPPPGTTGLLVARPALLAGLAVALAWTALALWWLRGALVRRAAAPGRAGSAGEMLAHHLWALPALLALAAWGTGAALATWGPRPAVLLDPCGDLPAGSEVWVTPVAVDGPDGGDGWSVSGGPPGPPCPVAAVAPLDG